MRQLLVLLLLASCAPAPEVLKDQAEGLVPLARGAQRQHEQLCRPPFPPSTTGGEPTARPPRCEGLLTCLGQVQAAAHRCKEAVDLAAAGQPYRAEGRQCLILGQGAQLRCQAEGVR